MSNQTRYSLASPLDVVAWLNTSKPLTLAELEGRVVVIHAFQMLCPGCVIHGVPQASEIYKLYPQQDVQVIGLHTVFEHHEVMTQKALAAFAHEYRIPFPIAIDRPSDTGPIPHTMASYQMQGTPTLIIIDKEGYVRLQHFGRMSDMQVGNIIGQLLEEKPISARATEETGPVGEKSPGPCDDNECPIPAR